MVMTAAVDMKPTLTIIKAEKMDGELILSLVLTARGAATLGERRFTPVDAHRGTPRPELDPVTNPVAQYRTAHGNT